MKANNKQDKKSNNRISKYLIFVIAFSMIVMILAAKDPGDSYAIDNNDHIRNISKASSDLRKENSEWSQVYKTFILDKGYASSERADYYLGTEERWGVTVKMQDLVFAIYDMDGDGTPELISNNGKRYAAAVKEFPVFSFKNGEIKYLDDLIDYSVYIDSTHTFPGLFTFFSHTGSLYSTYHFIRNNKFLNETVNSINVMVVDSVPQEIERTNNDALYKMGRVLPDGSMASTLSELKMYSIPEIRAMGWDTFVLKYL